MEATAPPWSTPWRRLRRVRVDSSPQDDYWHLPRLNIYTGHLARPGEIATNRHIIRMHDGLNSRVVFGSPTNAWLQRQLADHNDHWGISIPLSPGFKMPKSDDLDSFLSLSPGAAPPPPAAGPPPPPPPPVPARVHAWSDSALGWVAGTVLLAVFVLIVRATEKCLDKRLFKARRRQSEEWPTPNVLATSHHHTSSDTSRTDPDLQIDAPPPYSECTRPKPQCEDPPPPYSDCYVAFINPKDGAPSAHIIMPERDDIEDINTNIEHIEVNTENGDNSNPDIRNVTHANAVETHVGGAGANAREDNTYVNASEVNVGTVCAIDDDIEANIDSRVETVGVHIGSNVGNGSMNRDCVVVNETVRV